MDRDEAKSILVRALSEFASHPYDQLVASMKHTNAKTVIGESGANYQIEISVTWDSEPEKDLLIMGSIDDGGWRASLPLTESLIMKPDGTLI